MTLKYLSPVFMVDMPKTSAQHRMKQLALDVGLLKSSLLTIIQSTRPYIIDITIVF